MLTRIDRATLPVLDPGSLLSEARGRLEPLLGGKIGLLGLATECPGGALLLFLEGEPEPGDPATRSRPSSFGVRAGAASVSRMRAGRSFELRRASLSEFLDVDSDSTVPGAREVRNLVVVSTESENGGAMLFAEAPEGASIPSEASASAVAVFAELADMAAGARRLELLERRLRESCKLQAAVCRLLLAPDRDTLLSGLIEVVESNLGFSRVLLGLTHRASHTIRVERRHGFESSFAPQSLPLDRADDFAEGRLVRLLEQGEPVFFENSSERWADLRPLLGDREAGPGFLLPLRVERRLLGFLLADRPRTVEALLAPDLASRFSELASTAIEAFSMRTEAEERAHTDPLTGLYNRRHLDRVLELESARSRRSGRPISLLMLDLCDFKKINDSFGHLFGDSLLRETAWILKGAVRGHDVVVRYGGDEFVVLLAGADPEQARMVRDRIERALDERNRTVEDPRTRIVAGIGQATANAEDLPRLLENADSLMYREKSARTRRRMVESLLGLPVSGFEIVDHVVFNLLDGLERRMPHYRQESLRVAKFCLLAMRGSGIGVDHAIRTLLGAFLRDVGEVSLPSEMLLTNKPLQPAELRAIQMHPVVGEELFHGVAYMDEVRPVIRSHHERWDGRREGPRSGYPDGLAGDAIPLGARIVKVADTLSAMLGDRPWRAPLSPETVRAALREERGAAFDPALADALLGAPEWEGDIADLSDLPGLYREVLAGLEPGAVAVERRAVEN